MRGTSKCLFLVCFFWQFSWTLRHNNDRNGMTEEDQKIRTSGNMEEMLDLQADNGNNLLRKILT
jgi:hypothetical protein